MSRATVVLPDAVAPDERDRLTAADHEVETVEHAPARPVAERDALEPHLARARRAAASRAGRSSIAGSVDEHLVDATRRPPPTRGSCARSMPTMRSGQISIST